MKKFFSIMFLIIYFLSWQSLLHSFGMGWSMSSNVDNKIIHNNSRQNSCCFDKWNSRQVKCINYVNKPSSFSRKKEYLSKNKRYLPNFSFQLVWKWFEYSKLDYLTNIWFIYFDKYKLQKNSAVNLVGKVKMLN